MDGTDATPRMRIGAEREGDILVLTLDYPSRRNALAVPLRTEMEALLEKAQSDGTRCIVLTGSEGVFSAGGDISGMNVETALEGRERMRRTHRLVRLMARGNVPIIAAVEGWAAGAGCSLALLCDHVVAAEDARFVLGFHKIGLMADLALPMTLPARIGLGRARDMMLFHTQYTGEEAQRIGLVDSVAPNVLASALAMDKARARELFRSHGLPVAEGRLVTRAELAAGDPLPRPYVLKPNAEGSSVGVHILRAGTNRPDPADLPEVVLAEAYVPGRELTVSVLDDRALTVTEIVTEDWYDYTAKYAPGGSRHVCPAELPGDVFQSCLDMARLAHRALGCRGLSRTDFRWDDRFGPEGLVVLELNTQPGMTPTSLSPEQAAAVGLSFADLCRWLVEDASCRR